MRAVVFLFVMVALSWAVSSIAHQGGRDDFGCHNNKKTGEYECHESGSSSIKSPSAASVRKSATVRKLATKSPAKSNPAPVFPAGR